MSKLFTTLMAGAFALSLGGFAAAQNQPADPAAGGATNTPPAMSEEGSAGNPAATPAETPDAKAAADPTVDPAGTPAAKAAATPGANAAADPAAGGATVSKGEQEYLVALKKCESLADADKTKCVEAAKKKLGEM